MQHSQSNLILDPRTGNIVKLSELYKGKKVEVTYEELQKYNMHPQSGTIMDLDGNILSIPELMIANNDVRWEEIKDKPVEFKPKEHSHNTLEEGEFKFGYNVGEHNESGMITDKSVCNLSSYEKVTLSANAGYDETLGKVVHLNRGMGASKMIIDKSNYPKFTWSNAPLEDGSVQWISPVEVLTNYEPQQVCIPRPANSKDYNSYNISGAYVMSEWHDTNTPPNTYPYGILFVIGDGYSFSQIFMPHSSSHMMQYRTKFRDNDFTYWANVGFSALSQNEIKENEKLLVSLKERMETLEEKQSENILDKVKSMLGRKG